MIILAVGIMVIAAFALALFLAYDETRAEITGAEEAAGQREAERVREHIDVRRGGGNVTIESNWLGETRITGIVVECANGTMLTAPYEATAGDYNGTAILVEVRKLEAGC